MTNIILRPLKLVDLGDYYNLNLPEQEFHKLNAPYFKKLTVDELSLKITKFRESLIAGESNILKNKKIIADSKTDKIIGEVNWYWKSRATNWLEIGLVIFNKDYWGQGIGQQALTLWINELFFQNENLVRIGLTTWSGNIRMMKLAQKIGLKEEACYKKARFFNGQYFDSISYGILKEDWMKLNKI